MEKIIIGIDQSYKCTGVSIIANGIDILCMQSLKFEDCTNNTEKRERLKGYLYEQIIRIRKKYKDNCNIVVIVEQIRLISQGVLSQNYIKSTAALISVIIDLCYHLDISVYSVSTKSWKAQVVGTSKPLDNPYGINKEKYPTILYLKSKGLLNRLVEPYNGKGKKGIIPVKIDGEKVPCKINDDIADSYCICMYGFLPKSKQKLKLETF